MTYKLFCKDFMEPNCNFVVEGETKNDVIAKTIAHDKEAHGMSDDLALDPEVRREIQKKIIEN